MKPLRRGKREKLNLSVDIITLISININTNIDIGIIDIWIDPPTTTQTFNTLKVDVFIQQQLQQTEMNKPCSRDFFSLFPNIIAAVF